MPPRVVVVLSGLVCAAVSAAIPPTFPCGAANACNIEQVATDASGNIYVVGSRGLPSEAIVAKLSPDGGLLFFATFSGAHGSSYGHAIALDAAGNVYAGGHTSAPDFPLRNPIQNTIPSRGSSGFVLKLGPDGSQLIYSTFVGGTVSTQGRGIPTEGSSVNAIAADSAGNIYLTGATISPDFPVTPGMPAGSVGGGFTAQVGAFITKISATGDRILYSGRISGGAKACAGGSSCILSAGITRGTDIAVDAGGRAFVAGNSNVTDLPVTPGAYRSRGIGAWVARVNESGSALDYLTYLGSSKYLLLPNGPSETIASGLAIDAAGNAYVTGATSNPDFPTTPGAFQTQLSSRPRADVTIPGEQDAFLVKLNPQGSGLIYGTFLGGTAQDAATAVAIDGSGNAYIAGVTQSSAFPVTTGAISGGDFVAVLNAGGSALTYSSRFPSGSISTAMAMDAAGMLHLIGSTGTVSALSVTPGQPSPSPAPFLYAVVNAASTTLGQSLVPGEVVSLFGDNLGPSAGVFGQADNTGTLPNSIAGTQVLLDGVPLPLLYVSQGQINAVIPFFGLPGYPSIAVRTPSGLTTALYFATIQADPAIFLRDGHAAALNEDGSVNSESNPARAESIVTVWATGLGLVQPTPPDGQIATIAQPFTCCWAASNGVVYQGAAPGMVTGVVQFNVRATSDRISVAGSAPASIYLAQ